MTTLLISYCQAKNMAITLGHNLRKDELTKYGFVMWIVDVSIMNLRCDAVENYMFLRDSQLV